MELTEGDQRILDMKAQIRLKLAEPLLMMCSTAIDCERTLHVICMNPSIAEKLMGSDGLLKQIWIITGCLKLQIWLFNECFWEAEYVPEKQTEGAGVELASDEF